MPTNARAAPAGRNPALFRAVNEELRRIRNGSLEPTVDVICECSMLQCDRRISMPVDEFDSLLGIAGRFVVLEEHLSPDEHRVVGRYDGYLVVEMSDGAANQAATDPRGAIDSIAFGSIDEARAAILRLMSVAGAAYERRAQLEHALTSRIAIEQAKGIIAERYGLKTEDAFQLIRRAARTHRVKLHDLVRAIRPGEATPRELEDVVRGTRSA